MSHVTIIISRAPAATLSTEHTEPECSYEYAIPIPHGATPHQVSELVRKAFKRLESTDD